MSSLLGAKFSMDAEILHQDDDYAPETDTTDPQGHWVGSQDPYTFEIVNVWVPGPDASDDPDTEQDESTNPDTVPCIARAIVNTGISLAGTSEEFGDVYMNLEYLQMWVPGWVDVTKNDRITNIRDRRSGAIVWKDEEGSGNPTIFNVNGVTPLLDYRNRVTEKLVRLERAPGG